MNHVRRGAIAIALVIIAIATFIRFHSSESLPTKYVNTRSVVLGEPGSDHSHASILISIKGEPYNLSTEEYMERSTHAHMHDLDGRFIHKHADGVTLVYFLNTLGIRLTSDCLEIDGKSYCSGTDGKLTTLVNKTPLLGPLGNYEIMDYDKILIDFSNSSDFELQIMANAVPDLTEDLANGVE